MTEHKKIWLSPPHMCGKEKAFVDDAFASNWIAPLGPYVDDFEADICQYVQVNDCAALSSGTAAMHLALILSGVKEGDTVICPSFTFSATANPIVYEKAVPIFVDSEPTTWNMDPALLRVAINDQIKKNKKPKAIIVVHLYGMPALMDEIMQIAQEFGISVIEDAAESLGSLYHGKSTGTFGSLGVLSFNGNKIITTSGGGALIGPDPTVIKQARFLATQARDAAPHYQHSQIGYNYRMSNICAAIGCGQLTVIEERVAKRRAVHAHYANALQTVPGIQFLSEPDQVCSNRWLTTILVDEKTAGVSPSAIRERLKLNNIESRPLWKPLHLQPVFSAYPAYTNGLSEYYFQTGLCLPSGSALSVAELDRIIGIIKDTCRSQS